MRVSWKNESEACTECNTGVSKSFLSLLFESNQSFLFVFTLIFWLPSFVFVNLNDSDSLEFALLLQVSLMAYGDG